MFKGSQVIGVDVHVEQFGHPKNIEEIVSGAIDRAKQAFNGHDLGFGIESGLIQIPETKTGHMEITVCAIYDGRRIHMGLSPAFEWPQNILDAILVKGLDGSQAMKAVGLTLDPKIGERGGFIGMFSRGRINRTALNKSAIMMALIHLENPEHF